MTIVPPTVVVAICPSCGNVVEADALSETCGLIRPARLGPGMLNLHANCDLYQVMVVLGVAAYHLSKVTVYRIRRD